MLGENINYRRYNAHIKMLIRVGKFSFEELGKGLRWWVFDILTCFDENPIACHCPPATWDGHIIKCHCHKHEMMDAELGL